MGTPRVWRKSSYSGPGDGNSCLEIAHTRTLVAIRDSKAPAHGTLAFPTEAFGAFVRAIKGTAGRL
ncbi:DUF397 domain-containing protein [Streptomyces sp. NPDC000348]|uniref:DUF397 domain-containing protein n=1 Tax=Streptomyces sp. NPDC000348 TaxID=3364538 RepID=UPI0036A9E606